MAAVVLNRMPDNPFTDAERRALDEHVRSRQGELLLGTRELRRLERALEAREVFRAGPLGDAQAVELPVYPGRFEAVVEQAAAALGRAGS